jgi:hypothetical protein
LGLAAKVVAPLRIVEGDVEDHQFTGLRVVKKLCRQLFAFGRDEQYLLDVFADRPMIAIDIPYFYHIQLLISAPVL